MKSVKWSIVVYLFFGGLHKNWKPVHLWRNKKYYKLHSFLFTISMLTLNISKPKVFLKWNEKWMLIFRFQSIYCSLLNHYFSREHKLRGMIMTWAFCKSWMLIKRFRIWIINFSHNLIVFNINVEELWRQTRNTFLLYRK